MLIAMLPNELNTFLSFIVVFIFKARAVLHLSTQLILWNAVWWNFLAASSMASGAKVANIKYDIATQHSPRIKMLYIKINDPGVILL